MSSGRYSFTFSFPSVIVELASETRNAARIKYMAAWNHQENPFSRKFPGYMMLGKLLVCSKGTAGFSYRNMKDVGKKSKKGTWEIPKCFHIPSIIFDFFLSFYQ